MTDPMSPEELRACRERADAHVAPPHGQLVKQIALGQDVPALLATIAARDARLEAVADVLRANGCDCECGCDCDGHGDDCDPCLGCRIEAAMKGANQ